MTDYEIIEEAIRLVREGVNVTLPVKGLSMQPFIIGGKESVILHRPGLIDVGDVVLAWVDGNRYVVHRIIKLDYDRVTLMGDGRMWWMPRIRHIICITSGGSLLQRCGTGFAPSEGIY